MSSGLQLEVSDIWYQKGQTAINNTFLEDRKVSISLPLRGRVFSAYSRIALEQIVLPTFKYTTAEWMLSVALGSYNASINTFAIFMQGHDPYMYSNLSVSARMLKNITITQQLQYEYLKKKLIGTKTELEKRIFRNGYANLSYERNFSSKITNTEVGLRYDFSFANARASVRKSNQEVRYFQAINGSLIYDQKSKYTSFSNHSSVGKGVIILNPYLDMNNNGRHDPDEPKATGLNIRTNAGRTQKNLRDTTIRITDLEAYAIVEVELDPSGFENIAWQLRKKNYSIAVDPNSVKRVDVAVSISGEVAGAIRDKDSGKKLGGIILHIYNSQLTLVASTITEVDGYFSYLGLAPGKYFIQIDKAQLKKLHVTTTNDTIYFKIIPSKEGSIVDGLEFLLSAMPN
jgi:archaellin